MKLKKITAIVLSAVMALSMGGCGKEKEKVNPDKLDNITDAVMVFDKYKKGEFDVTVDYDYAVGNQNAKLTYSAVGDRIDDNVRSGLYVSIDTYKGSAVINMVNAITLYDDKLYLDFDRVVEAMSEAKTEIGSYGIPTPKLDSKKREELTKEIKDIGGGVIAAFLEGATVSGEKGEFTAKIQSVEDYRKSISAVLNYFDTHRDTIDKFIKDLSGMVDVKAYLNDVVDDMQSDLLDASDILGLGLTKSSIDSLKREIDRIEITEENTESMWEAFDRLKALYDEMTDEDWEQKYPTGGEYTTEISVSAKEDSYDLKIKTVTIYEDASGFVTITYSFKNRDDIKIEKPSNSKSLKEMANYFNENPSALSSIYYGMQKFAKSMVK